jgi:hypothetical protein
MTRLQLLFIVAALAACAPKARSSAYFEHHPQAIEPTLRRYASGAQRGGECVNAGFSQATIRSAARLELYRRGF